MEGTTFRDVFFFSTRSNTHKTHTHTQLAQVHKYSSSRNKINVVFVRSDNHQYVSDWLRLDSTRLAPHGMFTSRAEKKKKTPPPKEEQTQHKKKRTMSRERELSDLGKGLRLVCATSVEDNSGVATEKINIGDFIDVLNANHRWEPASVRDLAVRQGCAQVRVLFEDADNAGKLEWIPFESGRIAPFGKMVGAKHHPYHKGQLVDVLHEFFDSKGNQKSKWRNGEVLSITNYQVQVSFLKLGLDQWIDVSREPGKSRVTHAFTHTEGSADAHVRELQDAKFREKLKKAGCKVFEVENDGNCLFRAVALQTLGDVSMHAVVRKKCCKHLSMHRKHFKNFVGDDKSFESYLTRMSKDCVWGGHMEIIAMEEIWDRQIMIYRSDDTKDIPEPQSLTPVQLGEQVTPILLSYHGHSHYNALANIRSSVSFPLPNRATRILLEARLLENATSPGAEKEEKEEKEEEEEEKEEEVKESTTDSIYATNRNEAAGVDDVEVELREDEKKKAPTTDDIYSNNRVEKVVDKVREDEKKKKTPTTDEIYSNNRAQAAAEPSSALLTTTTTMTATTTSSISPTPFGDDNTVTTTTPTSTEKTVEWGGDVSPTVEEDVTKVDSLHEADW